VCSVQWIDGAPPIDCTEHTYKPLLLGKCTVEVDNEGGDATMENIQLHNDLGEFILVQLQTDFFHGHNNAGKVVLRRRRQGIRAFRSRRSTDNARHSEAWSAKVRTTVTDLEHGAIVPFTSSSMRSTSSKEMLKLCPEENSMPPPE